MHCLHGCLSIKLACVERAGPGCCTAGLLCEGIMHRAEGRCGRNITWHMEFEQVPMVQASDEDQELADSFAWRYSKFCHR